MQRPSRGKVILFLFAGLLVTAAAVVFAAARIAQQTRLKHQWDAFRERGLPTTLLELDASYPYPEGRDPTCELLDAIALPLVPIDAPEEVAVVMAVETNPIEPAAWSGAQLEAARIEVAHARKRIDALIAAAPRSPARYPMDFVNFPKNAFLTVLSSSSHRANLLLMSAHKLWLAAGVAAHDGDGAAAADALLTALGLARSLELEPTLRAQDGRQSLLAETWHTARDVLALTPLPKEKCRELIRLLEQAEAPGALRRGVAGSAVMFVTVLDAGDPKRISQRTESRVFSHSASVQAWRFGGAADAEAAQFLADALEALDILDLPFPERHWKFEATVRRPRRQGALSSRLRFLSIGGPYPRASGAATLAYLRTMRTALAAYLFVQDRGCPPKALEELAPEYLKTMPIDPFTGQPLRMVCGGHDLRIYSVGENVRDDEGQHGHGIPGEPLATDALDDIAFPVPPD